MASTNASMQNHWNRIYATAEITRLGWYEDVPEKSLHLIGKSGIQKHECILDAGSGASTLLDTLLDQGYSNIIAVDLSEMALERAKERLGADKSARVQWVVDDLTQPQAITRFCDVAVWHDRAVLHFLLTETQRQAYRTTLRTVLRPGGYAIIATFSIDGAKKCSGLDLYTYDAAMLAEFLGEEFQLQEHFNYTYTMPSGEPRPYVYTLFKRVIS